eukprot:365363-Chlamydomonas_euryale.AAC.1
MGACGGRRGESQVVCPMQCDVVCPNMTPRTSSTWETSSPPCTRARRARPPRRAVGGSQQCRSRAFARASRASALSQKKAIEEKDRVDQAG